MKQEFCVPILLHNQGFLSAGRKVLRSQRSGTPRQIVKKGLSSTMPQLLGRYALDWTPLRPNTWILPLKTISSHYQKVTTRSISTIPYGPGPPHIPVRANKSPQMKFNQGLYADFVAFLVQLIKLVKPRSPL